MGIDRLLICIADTQTSNVNVYLVDRQTDRLFDVVAHIFGNAGCHRFDSGAIFYYDVQVDLDSIWVIAHIHTQGWILHQDLGQAFGQILGSQADDAVDSNADCEEIVAMAR